MGADQGPRAAAVLRIRLVLHVSDIIDVLLHRLGVLLKETFRISHLQIRSIIITGSSFSQPTYPLFELN